MLDQTSVNQLETFKGYAMPGVNSGGETAGVKRVVADVVELAELQARLIASDARCLAQSALRPIILGAISVVLLLGTIPILLLGAADFLVRHGDWSAPTAQLAVAGVVILVGVILGVLATKSTHGCGPPLRNSLAEFEKNIDTLREILGGNNALQSHLGQMERRNTRN
jgi:hypothetical protein